MISHKIESCFFGLKEGFIMLPMAGSVKTLLILGGLGIGIFAIAVTALVVPEIVRVVVPKVVKVMVGS